MSKHKQKESCPLRKTSIGGQALLEGIMMRGPETSAMAVRDPRGKMVLETWETKEAVKFRFGKLPFIRGIFNFIASMTQGYKCLMRSADIATDGLTTDLDGTPLTEESPAPAEAESEIPVAEAAEPTEAAESGSEPEPAPDAPKPEPKKENNAMMNTLMVVAMVLGVALAIVLFKMVPEGLYDLLLRLVPALDGKGYGYNLLRAAFCGILKIAILVVYMALVSRMKDIRRTFMYHGAEHKTIACYEAGEELTVENVRTKSRLHPRCGTSFLILMVLVGILVTMFIPSILLANRLLNTLLRTGISVLLLPVVMGIGYELLKFAGRHDNLLVRIISAPGMALQKITTVEPEDGMIECAIAALKEAIPKDDSDKW